MMYRKSAAVSKTRETSFARRIFKVALAVAASMLLMQGVCDESVGPEPVPPDNGRPVVTPPPDTGKPAVTPPAGNSNNWYFKDTSAAKFTISTAAELAGLAELVNGGNTFGGKTITLTKDISLSAYGSNYRDGKGWVPIGGSKAFSGIFDGDGHLVSGLYINDIELNRAGLFGNLYGDSVVVKNIGVIDVSIRANGEVGAIVGRFSNGKITNCYSTGTVKGVGDNVGGMLGWSNYYGVIRSCYSNCSVVGRNTVGGLLGGGFNVNVTNCYSTGAIQGNDVVGGIIGTPQCCGHIDYCMALNTYVKVLTGTGVGRITTNGYQSLNVAFNGIINNAGTTEWTNKGADKLGGADITSAQLSSDGTIGGRFTEDFGWTVEDGKLPGLFGKAVEMPAYLR